MVSKN